MIPNDVITIEPGQKSKNALPKTFSPTRILVPVDSSGNAFDSLAYTLRLAKAWNAGVHLYYIIDVDEIPDTGSAFAIQYVLNRLESKAINCLESLKEIIQETGVEIVSAEFEIGRPRPLLRKKIESAKPGLIVSGRGGVHKDVLKNLLSQTTCPVLIVPEATEPKAPSSVLFLNGQADLRDHLLDSIEIILKTSQQIHILTTAKGRLEDFKKARREDLTVTVHSSAEAEPVKAAEQFVNQHKIDMVCMSPPDQSFIEKLFGRCIPLDLAWRLKIPVLVIR